MGEYPVRKGQSMPPSDYFGAGYTKCKILTFYHETMRIPGSLGIIALSFVLYGVQHIPIVGFALLLVGAPLWSVGLINCGILGIGVEAFIRRVHRVWLIVPVLWFGGNAAWAAFDHVTLTGLRDQIAQNNASVQIPFDAEREALVGNAAAGIRVGDFDFPVFYTESQGSGGADFRASRLANRKVCDHIRDDSLFAASGVRTFGLLEKSERRAGRSLVRDFCVVDSPEEPGLPTVRITVSTEETIERGMPVEFRTITVLKPDGRRYFIRGGQATPRPWLPIPIMGCVPTMAKPSRACGMGLSRSTPVPLITGSGRFGSEGVELARALGLTAIKERRRQAMSDEQLLDHLDLSKRRVVEHETAALDHAIADPMADIGSVPFNSLRGREDIIVPRIEGMVAAIEWGVANGGNARSNAQQMFNLLGKAPPSAVEPYLERLYALNHQDRWFRFARNIPPPETVGEPIVVSAKH